MACVHIKQNYGHIARAPKVQGTRQGRNPRREIDNRLVVEHRKEVAVPPQGGGSVPERAAAEGASDRVDFVANFERPETRLTHGELNRRIFCLAFSALQTANVSHESAPTGPASAQDRGINNP